MNLKWRKGDGRPSTRRPVAPPTERTEHLVPGKQHKCSWRKRGPGGPVFIRRTSSKSFAHLEDEEEDPAGSPSPLSVNEEDPR